MPRLSESDFDEIICRIAANDPTLTKFYPGLYGNGLGDDGAVRIAAALRENTHVTTLLLGGNQIGVVGANALAGILADNSALTTLYLDANSIGDDGAAALAGMLAANSTLTELYLNANSIGDDGATALASALLSNATLTNVSLAGNSIDDDGATAFVNALLSNGTLTELYLNANSISSGLEEDIRALVRMNAAEEPEEARRSKIVYRIGQLVKAEGGADHEAAIDLALDELGVSFPEATQRQGLFGQLLGSAEHGADVARSVETVPRGRALYWYAAECGAAPAVLMNVLRAHPSLCGTCRDVQHKLFPFMFLATLPDATVNDVMELLLCSPNLVERAASR